MLANIISRTSFLLVIVLFSSLPLKSIASEAVDVFLNKSTSGQWTVSFQLQKPTSKIGFSRNPNDARVKRWKPLSNDFVIVYEDEQEFIKRKDLSDFLTASFLLEPSHTSLPKDYAPFSAFSDGGLLIHDGRFFACAETCDHEIDYNWRIEMIAPESDNIIVDEKIYHSKVTWQANNSGSYFYVGKQKAIETDEVIAIVDINLPEKLKRSLEVSFPRMMKYFIEQFGPLKNKPSLFASYEKNNNEGMGSQGGTLPKQVFMHWFGMGLEKISYLNDTVWFFAHESAHMYQKESGKSANADQAWLNEGSAEKFALMALQELNPELVDYTQYRIKQFRESCEKGIIDVDLSNATKQKLFKLHYSCGFLMHHSIDLTARKQSENSKNIFDVWRDYQQEIIKGAPADQQTYFSVVEKYTNRQQFELLKKFVKNSKDNFSELVKSI